MFVSVWTYSKPVLHCR